MLDNGNLDKIDYSQAVNLHVLFGRSYEHLTCYENLGFIARQQNYRLRESYQASKSLEENITKRHQKNIEKIDHMQTIEIKTDGAITDFNQQLHDRENSRKKGRKDINKQL